MKWDVRREGQESNGMPRNKRNLNETDSMKTKFNERNKWNMTAMDMAGQFSSGFRTVL